MRLRPFPLAIILALVATGAQAQTRVRTESIKPPGAAATPPAPPAAEDKKDKPAGNPPRAPKPRRPEHRLKSSPICRACRPRSRRPASAS